MKRNKGANRRKQAVDATPKHVPALNGSARWRTHLSSNRIVLCLLALAVLVFYGAPLFDEDASIQWDAVDVHYSAQKYFSDMVHAGKLPFWTPYVYSGMPFLADPQTGAWYPPNWPFFLIGITPRALEWELALHAFMACAGAFLLARGLLQSVPASVLAALLYGLSGFFAGHSSHLGIFQAASLFPWLLLSGRSAMDRGSIPSIAASGLIGGCVILAGHFQTALYCFFGLGCFLIARAAPQWSRIARAAIVLAGSGAIAIAVSAIQILPGLELTANSIRAHADYSRETNAPLVWGALATLWDPDHYGVVTGSYKGPPDVTQFYFYGGLLLIPLALAGVWKWRGRWHALALVVPALWYALGPSFGLYLAIAKLPGFKSVRAPVHIWFAIALGLALLAAAGLKSLRAWFLPRWAVVAVLAFTFGDLWYSNMARNGLAYARKSFQELYGRPFETYQSMIAPFRSQPLHRIWAPAAVGAFGPLNSALEARTESTYGYNPLELDRYAAFDAQTASNPKLLHALGVTTRLEVQGGRLISQPVSSSRAGFAQRVMPVRDADEARARLTAVDPQTLDIVEGMRLNIQQDPHARARIVNYEGDRYRIQYQAASESLLRIAVPYFPGWRAEVDGRRLAVLPTDLALSGVVVPAGSHELTFRYSSNWFMMGAAISVVTALVLVQIQGLAKAAGFVLLNERVSDQAACQISGILTLSPPSLPVLNRPFLIFSASSIPLITTAAFRKLFRPGIGRSRCFTRR